MTEDQFISRLVAGWPQDTEASLHVIALADEAVRAFPMSPRLLVMRGDLIQLGAGSCPHPLEEALHCYRRAVEIAPDFAEGWEEMGHYYDEVLDDEVGARPHFDRAAALKGESAAQPNSGPAQPSGTSGTGGEPLSVS